MDDIKDIASRTPVRNDIRKWNSQDYVLDLLELLEQVGILDVVDDDYWNKRDILVTISNPPDPNNTHEHWALYLNDPSNPIKTIFEVKGSTGRYRYEPEIKPQNVRLSRDLVGLVPICTVEPSKASKIKEIAGTVRVRNEVEGWNSLCFVGELFNALEREGVVDGEDEDYLCQMAHICPGLSRNRRVVEL